MTDADKARQLGAKAYRDGKKCVPAWDTELMAMLQGEPVGGKGAKLAKEWSDGYIVECLNDNIEKNKAD